MLHTSSLQLAPGLLFISLQISKEARGRPLHRKYPSEDLFLLMLFLPARNLRSASHWIAAPRKQVQKLLHARLQFRLYCLSRIRHSLRGTLLPLQGLSLVLDGTCFWSWTSPPVPFCIRNRQGGNAFTGSSQALCRHQKGSNCPKGLHTQRSNHMQLYCLALLAAHPLHLLTLP